MKYYLSAFNKIFNFKGKANMKEFWYYFIINFIINIFLLYVGIKIFDTDLISDVYRFISLVPFISLGFRRLRDAGFNPWLFLIPVVNLILAGIPKNE